MESFEIVNCGPYRFIGKAMFVRAGKSDALCGALFEKYSDWVFETLDGMKEYASDAPHNAAFLDWSRYDQKNGLMGYTIGRFMKADTPVPEDMDYIDIPAGFIAKVFIEGDVEGDVTGDACKMLRDEIKRLDIYRPSRKLWWSAEIYPKPDENGVSHIGYYESYELKGRKGNWLKRKQK
ncbi:MAG: hypothetical protein FWF60_08695 [Oscillospiraceae bacterium]|nr:hypothetical protein [Oscillospiraceae bacterium]